MLILGIGLLQADPNENCLVMGWLWKTYQEHPKTTIFPLSPPN